MTMIIPKSGCTIRCYRHFLGDCFLLGFKGKNNHKRFMLIDCGLLVGSPDADNKMKKVARDIKKECNGKLDVLVVTHEHWDHISGFSQAQSVFKDIKVDIVWFAWTEDPDDPLAKQLRERKKRAFMGLAEIEDSPGFEESEYSSKIAGLMNFYGEKLGASRRLTTEGTMKWIKEQWPNHKYCKPGDRPNTIAGLPDMSFFVLGPPRDKKFIRKSRPSKKGNQVYLETAHLDHAFAALGLSGASQEISAQANASDPFSPAYKIIAGDGWSRDGFDRPISPENDINEMVTRVVTRYEDEGWRQIDTGRSQMAHDLAMRLDAHTNNTSLVLAIELSPGGKVLLFPADAQVGSWLSWHTVEWQDHPGLTAKDLLERTCFYKVGHHASHNATLKKEGLEMMESDDLQAFISVDQKTAQKRRWHMPFSPLLKRLNELTDDKVYMADTDLSESQKGEHLKQTELYLDIRIDP